jgi:H+/Cl- antiporter ClcA
VLFIFLSVEAAGAAAVGCADRFGTNASAVTANAHNAPLTGVFLVIEVLLVVGVR